MTETARVVAINGKTVSVVPLNVEVCLGCSNDHCKSQGSVFTVKNRKKFDLKTGDEVRIGASPAHQVLQAVFSLGFPLLSGVLVYAAFPSLMPFAGAGLRAGVALGALFLSAIILARSVRIGEKGFPEITEVTGT